MNDFPEPNDLPESLDDIARELNDTYQRLIRGLRMSQEQKIRIGQLLLRAKRSFRKSRSFTAWCDKVFPVRERQRQRYMAYARHPEKLGHIREPHDFNRNDQEMGREASKQLREERIAEAVKRLKANKLPNNLKWQVHHVDNRKFPWPMVDHIFTDPPWPQTETKLDHYRWLAEMAASKLKEGGWLAVQCGTPDIPQVLPIFEASGFTCRWTLAIVYPGNTHNIRAAFIPFWRPLLLFARGQVTWPSEPITDTVTVAQGDKMYDDWQQPLKPFRKWIPALTKAGDVIGDPFGGTGTYALACKLTGRQCISMEVREEMVAVARLRLEEEYKEITKKKR